jgi:hypothetical protein
MLSSVLLECVPFHSERLSPKRPVWKRRIQYRGVTEVLQRYFSIKGYLCGVIDHQLILDLETLRM